MSYRDMYIPTYRRVNHVPFVVSRNNWGEDSRISSPRPFSERWRRYDYDEKDRKKIYKEKSFNIKSLHKYYKLVPNVNIDPDNICNINEKAKEDVTCAICYCIFNDPTKLHCGHNFCRTCLDRVTNNSCPLCRSNFRACIYEGTINGTVNIILQTKIKSLDINCDKCFKVHNIATGCRNKVMCTFCYNKVSKKKFLAHLKKHCFSSSSIKKCGLCNKYEFENLLNEHNIFCKMKKIKCKYCFEYVLSKNLNNHETECAQKIKKICKNCGEFYTAANKHSHAFLCNMKMEEKKNKREKKKKRKEMKNKHKYSGMRRK